MTFPIEGASRAPSDRVFVSWSESWDIVDYVDRYLRARKYAATPFARDAVMRCITRYPGPPPYRKADMDFYLDRNLVNYGPLPPRGG